MGEIVPLGTLETSSLEDLAKRILEIEKQSKENSLIELLKGKWLIGKEISVSRVKQEELTFRKLEALTGIDHVELFRDVKFYQSFPEGGYPIQSWRRFNEKESRKITGNGKVSETMNYWDVVGYNPFVGCNFNCAYCKPTFKRQVARRKNKCLKCGTYEPHYHPERLGKIPSGYETIAVCQSGDISFCEDNFLKEIVSTTLKERYLDPTSFCNFFWQSKNPKTFERIISLLNNAENAYLLTTLETNIDKGYEKWSKAPLPSKRYQDFLSLDWPRKIVTVEPVMSFDMTLLDWILDIKPKAVYIGMNSRPKDLKGFLDLEPEGQEIPDLISGLRQKGIQVLLKSFHMGFKP